MEIEEISERCDTGEIMDEDSFDLKVVYPGMKDVIKKYEIRYNPDELIPTNENLIERVFQAALDFFIKVGFYCKDTHRVVRFTKEEVIENLKKGPRPCIAGEGSDKKEWKTRLPDDNSRPWCFVGSGIHSSNDEYAEKLVEFYGSVERADSIAIPTLNHYKNVKIQPMHPVEILGVLHTARLSREALEKVGRPGVAIFNNMPTSGSAQGTIASCHPLSGLRASDGWLIPVLAEMKVDYASLSRVALLGEMDANYAVASSAMLGGYIGGAEGVAIASVSYVFLSLLTFNTNYHCNFPITLRESISTTREMLWAVSVASQVVARYTNMPMFNIGYLANGPATENYFYEALAYMLCSIPTGVTCINPFPHKGVLTDGLTPMEVKFYVEYLDKIASIKRENANEIIIKLVEKYESSLKKPDAGKSYPECFDIRNNKPRDDYMRLYDAVKEEISKLGL